MRNETTNQQEYYQTYSDRRGAELREKKRQYYHANKHKQAERRKKAPEVRKSYHLRTQYGLTLKQYNSMLIQQENSCAICRVSRADLDKDLCVDHCHKTGIVRGLLCSSCNVGLGRFKDLPSVLISASNYLENFLKGK